MIKSIVNLIEEIEKLLTFVTFNNAVELMNINEYDGNLSFIIREVLFTTSYFISHDTWDKQIENLSKLLVVANFLVTTDKGSLFLEFLHVDIYTPYNSHEYPKSCSVGIVEVLLSRLKLVKE